MQRQLNVDATSWRCIDVEATLYKRHVPAGMIRFMRAFVSVCVRTCVCVCVLTSSKVELLLRCARKHSILKIIRIPFRYSLGVRVIIVLSASSVAVYIGMRSSLLWYWCRTMVCVRKNKILSANACNLIKNMSLTIPNLVPQRPFYYLNFISVAKPQKFGNKTYDAHVLASSKTYRK